MASTDDVFDSLEAIIAARPNDSPWTTGVEGVRVFSPDHVLLEQLLAVPIGAGAGSESGRLAKAIDAWVAHELRRAGFFPDEVWPRLQRPRVLPREVALFIEGLPKKQQEEVGAWNDILADASIPFPSMAEMDDELFLRRLASAAGHAAAADASEDRMPVLALIRFCAAVNVTMC